jgi:predicted GIY-YIG superfamily endonuclease
MFVGCPTSLFVCSMSLLFQLREYRQIRSVVEKVPIYCVFGDTVIQSIASNKPNSKQELQGIRGLSEDKCQLYGDDIIAMVNKFGSKVEAKQGGKPLVVIRHSRKSSIHDHWTRRRGLLKTFDVSLAKPVLSRTPCAPSGGGGVYVLELAQGRVYVGHSMDVRRRILQHMSGQGSAFTKAFPPTGVHLPRLGCVSGSPEAAERDETLRYMFLRGIQLVRGWRYVRVEMADEEVQDAEQNIRELYDLCRRCGHPGHFVTHCKANFDRLGKACKR